MATTPTQLFHTGYCDLISVIPPGASLALGSKITPASLGKVPGRKLSSGRWAGFAWRTHTTTLADVQAWETDAANIGLRAGRFPGLDIDSLDEGVASEVEKLALRLLGDAPVRVGKPPKRLLMYRTDEPFTRMRLLLEDGQKTIHLIELLADGQQYLVHGIHPGTMRPYEWSVPELPAATDLTPITREQVATLFDEVAREFEARGFTVHREGDGRSRERTRVADQASLLAPSIEELRAAVALIPNAGEEWASRDSYVRMGYAIRAAAGADSEDGFDIFWEWCECWDGEGNDFETVRADWDRMHPPYSIGWDWIAAQARAHGYNDAASEFPAEGTPPVATPRRRVEYSDRWLADVVIERVGDRLRYGPGLKAWLVWTGQRWDRDEMNRPRTEIRDLLHEIACDLITARPKAVEQARSIESATRLRNVMTLMEADPRVIVAMRALDADPWLLNTPTGVVDLHTGLVRPHDPMWLMTKMTRVSVDREHDCPRWKAFLLESTGGNPELVAYLQRMAGYCLTGLTDEHAVVFVYGPGGNGKSVCLNTLTHILGDYATTAPMSTFMANRSERHPTEVATLHGARLVTASETSEGGRWNEERLKNLSGGDPVTARFLYHDFFTFQPQFKLLLIGNRKPSLDTVDEAMRRRLHLVPFTVKPEHPDPNLIDKLRAEAPAILAWMVDGALAWQAERLSPPAVVQEATNQYFEDQDLLGRWLAEECELADKTVWTLTRDLYERWREWCGERGEQSGSLKRLSQMLADCGFQRLRNSTTGRFGFAGIRLRKSADWGMGVAIGASGQ
jgi:P4 family phage/plasmid primase-like protien